MLSGVRLSCYQEYENAGKPVTARVCDPSNITNLNSLTISREAASRWTTAAGRKNSQQELQKTPRSTRQKQSGLPSWRAAP
ncbi:hypothetical protein HB742_12835 [Pseudomonas aeruginosa]|uniref:Uncharacterized protein n=1 Tax=Malikia granosa TaxID=263067 RepID=A0A2S9K684_9BURK|nr:hypothetical protein [Salmonella enterica]MAF00796.1 hypothetical protein [Herbaspirillum sp.]MPT13274.1 hypothetical protein [Comamonas sp.]PRD65902.1 hypothetical protein C6P64_07320 [Malikia granosa]QKR15733.1 hypothetical protein HB742_12835 [Pseudomonas aeruginosa]